jgi:hypothetical protein
MPSLSDLRASLRGGGAAPAGLVRSYDERVHGGGVEGSRHPQGPREGPPALGLGEAGGVRVQVRAAAGQPAGRVGHQPAVDGDHPEQLAGRRLAAAADAGPHRAVGRHGAQVGLGALSGAGAPPTGTSGLMSMRHPVSRAASRAFWPSRPIASDSW